MHRTTAVSLFRDGSEAGRAQDLRSLTFDQKLQKLHRRHMLVARGDNRASLPDRLMP